MDFVKVRGNSPTNKRPPWRQFLAANGGIILTWVIVLMCIIAAMRMHSSDEEDGSAAKPKVFADPQEVIAPIGGDDRTRAAVAAVGGSSLDSAPKWGGLQPASDDGGPIEAEPPKKEEPAPAPAPAPPPTGGIGIALPGIDASKVAQGLAEEGKKMLPKPSAPQAGGGAASGMSQFVSFQERENKEKAESAKTFVPAGQPSLGAGQAPKRASAERAKTGVVFSGGGPAGVERMPVEKEILYKIEDVVKKAGERSAETGAAAQITDAEAKALVREIGIKMGSADKRPNPNSQ